MTFNTDEDAPTRSRMRWLLGTMALLAIPLMTIWWPGCRQYPPLTNTQGMQMMKLLYAACNTRDMGRLGRVEQGIEKLTREGKMSAPERQGFDQIIAMAKAGKWENAEAAAMRFAQDQVGVGHPAPDEGGREPNKSSKAKGR